MRMQLTQIGASLLSALGQQLAQGMVVSLPWVIGDLSRLAVPVEARDALAGRAAHDAVHLSRQGDKALGPLSPHKGSQLHHAGNRHLTSLRAPTGLTLSACMHAAHVHIHMQTKV